MSGHSVAASCGMLGPGEEAFNLLGLMMQAYATCVTWGSRVWASRTVCPRVAMLR